MVRSLVSRLLFIFSVTLSIIFGYVIVGLSQTATAEPISVEEYRETLLTALQILESTEGLSLPPENLTRLNELLPSQQVVVLDNQEIQVKNRWFLNALDELKRAKDKAVFKQKLEDFKKRLSLLLEETDIASDYYHTNQKVLLKQILSREEFSKKPVLPFLKSLAQWIDQKTKAFLSRIEKAYNRFLERIIPFLSRFIKFFPTASDSEPSKDLHLSPTIFLYVMLGISAIIFFIFFIRYRWYTYFLKPDIYPKPQGADEGQAIELRHWQVIREHAQEALMNGEMKLAFHYLYLSLLLFLQQQKILVYHESTTNWEYIKQLENYPSLYQSLKRVTVIFEQIWYGAKSFDAKIYDEFIFGYNQIIENKDL